MFLDEIELFKKTTGINKIPSGPNATRSEWTKSYPAKKGLIRAKQNAFDENTILVGSFPTEFSRTKSRLNQNSPVRIARDSVYRERDFVSPERILFFKNAILFVENETKFGQMRFCLSWAKFCRRRTKAFGSVDVSIRDYSRHCAAGIQWCCREGHHRRKE